MVREVVRGVLQLTPGAERTRAIDGPGAGLSGSERIELDAELGRAAEALSGGNAGKARVCARRACGVALRAWHRSRRTTGAPADAQSLLRLASADPGLPAGAREAARRLSAPAAGPTAAVTADPLADARLVIDAVLGDA